MARCAVRRACPVSGGADGPRRNPPSTWDISDETPDPDAPRQIRLERSGPPDHARPLNKRGRRAAAALGHWLRETGHLPDEILCSTAARAQETLARLALPRAPVLLDTLYMAEPPAMLTALRRGAR